MTARGEAIAVYVDVAGKSRPVPADIVLIVWREDAVVENFKRCLKPWRARALQDHSALLRIGCGDDARARSAGHMQIDRLLRKCPLGHERETGDTQPAQRSSPH